MKKYAVVKHVQYFKNNNLSKKKDNQNTCIYIFKNFTYIYILINCLNIFS